MIQKLLFIGAITASFLVSGQHINSQLLDKETLEPVPYASIQFSENNAVMSNEEGAFELLIPDNSTPKDSLTISSLGYQSKSFSLQDSIPKTIYLESKIYEIDPVILSNKSQSVEDIMDQVIAHIAENYQTNYIKNDVFVRLSYRQRIVNFDFDVKKSTIDNINQTLFDTIVEKLPKSFTSLTESYANIYSNNNKEAKLNLKKVLMIQSKQEIASIRQIQNDFFTTLQKNTKHNSYLIIKSGIIRLDKTESIDSIVRQNTPHPKPLDAKRKKGFQVYAAKQLQNILKDLCIHDASSIDFLDKYNRYEFTKEGYIEIGDAIAYVIRFKPKGSAKYKGTLYINTEDYAILRADIQGARKIFDKHFNMFGISSNDLTYSSTLIFEKSLHNNYYLKYLKISRTAQNGVNRPIKIIEKNKYVKGRRKQNEVAFQMNIQIVNESTKELVFTAPESVSQSSFENFKPDLDIEIKRVNSYDSHFWDGYNIITPEQAIKNLKIE